MTSVMESTNIDRPKTERAGVPAGSKMLVGDCAHAVPATKDTLQTALLNIQAGMVLIFGMSANENLVKGDKAV